jgi:hypothetical protein
MRRLSIAFAATVLLAGCGEAAESTLPVAGVTEMAGPYQAEPYRAFDQALVRKLEDECATSIADDRLELALADGRGGGRILLVYSGPEGMSAECSASIGADGDVFVDGSGSSSGSGGPGPAPNDVQPSSGGSSDGPSSWSYLHGVVGSDIARVVIRLADDTPIEASIGGGRFAVWWSGEAQPTRILGYDGDGNLVHDERY